MQIFPLFRKKTAAFGNHLIKNRAFSAIFRQFFVNMDEIHVLGRKMWMAIFLGGNPEWNDLSSD